MEALRAREMSAHDGWHSVVLRVGRLRECCEARERREAQRLAEMSEEDRFIARQQAAEDEFDAEMEAMSEQECKKMMLEGGGAEDWREYPFRERVYMAHYDRLTPDAERQNQLDRATEEFVSMLWGGRKYEPVEWIVSTAEGMEWDRRPEAIAPLTVEDITAASPPHIMEESVLRATELLGAEEGGEATDTTCLLYTSDAADE